MSQDVLQPIDAQGSRRILGGFTQWCVTGLGNRWRYTPWWLPSSVAQSQTALLRVLQAANQDQLEIAPLVETLAHEHRRSARWRFKVLARKLRTGMPTITAIEQVPDALRSNEVTMIRLGLQCGVVSQAYEQMLATRSLEDQHRVSWRHYAVYSVVLICFIILMTAFLAAFIAPTISEIMEELGIEPTPSHMRFREVMSLSIFPVLAFLVPLVGLALLIFAVRVPVQAFVRRRILRPLTPGHRFEDVTELLDMLSLIMRNGRPVQAAISSLAKYHHAPRIRNQLLFVRNEIDHGVNAVEALRQVGLLPDKAARAILSCDSTTDRGWLMKEIVAWRRGRARHWRNMISVVAGPMFVVLCGIVVFWSVVAIFSVLLRLTLSLS